MKQPDSQVYEAKLKKLKVLLKLEDAGVIDLLFGDETGFNLEPYIPYGWLKIGQQTPIPSQRQKVGNVFGVMSRYGQAQMFWTHQNINSAFIIKCLDQLADSIQKITVVVLDQASWHTAKSIQHQLQHWAKKGLYIFYLPPYSPHLNLIEILWRKIKYEWLETHDYLSAEHLAKAVLNIFQNLNNGFSIKFSKNSLFYL